MLGMEEILFEMSGAGGEDDCCCNSQVMKEHGLAPGFRFHPTDEELVTFYLASKVFHGSFSGVPIAELDLNRCEPWELPEVAKMGEKEWYFFSLRDRKYPTGLRTNRATGAGYWKATGKDREVYGASTGALLGMKKTLVFYKGRAPRGLKTRWVMHEYRLHGDFSYPHSSKEEWVICRIFQKAMEKKYATYGGGGGTATNETSPAPAPAPTTTTYVSSILLPPLLDALTNNTTLAYKNNPPLLLEPPPHLIIAQVDPFLVPPSFSQQQNINNNNTSDVDDLKSLVMTNPSIGNANNNNNNYNGFQSPSFCSPNNKSILVEGDNDSDNNMSSSSMLFLRSLVSSSSHQLQDHCNGNFKQLTTNIVAKQCKTETKFSIHDYLHAPNNNIDHSNFNSWLDKINQPYTFPNPMLCNEMNWGNAFGFLSSSAAAPVEANGTTTTANGTTTVHHDMFTSLN